MIELPLISSVFESRSTLLQPQSLPNFFYIHVSYDANMQTMNKSILDGVAFDMTNKSFKSNIHMAS